MDRQADPTAGQPRLAPSLSRISEWPWWALVALALGVYIIYNIIADERSTAAFWFVMGQRPADLSAGVIAFRGFVLTIGVAFAAYMLAVFIGVFIGIGRISPNKIYRNVATFYVEVVRGIPILVLLIYIAFVGVPGIIGVINSLGDFLVGLGLNFAEALTNVSSRNFSNTWRVIIGLGLAYGAFSAEIVRAGIESIGRGQIEAAQALGMSYWQSMRLIILPQAIRRVLPAYGNDLVAIVKDSSLVTVLGVADMTQLAKLHAASTFLFFQTYSILAFLYLILTISLTRFVRWVERRFPSEMTSN